MAAEEKKEDFLERWSRLKRESVEEKAEESPDPKAPPPPVEKLTPESDFTGFMHPKVDDALRRVALKKLFSDPHFNLPDPFEAYSGDWTGGEPIPQEMLAALNQAQRLLFNDKEKKEEEKQAQAANEAEAKTNPDDTGKQDA